MRLTDLGKGWLSLPAAARRVDATGIACDSRAVRPGDLFVAVSGEKMDGHLFIPEALRAGAVAVVGERKHASSGLLVPFIPVEDSRLALGRLSAAFYQHPSREVSVVGVTGTKGKTTTAWLLAAIFEAAGRRAGLFGTVLNRIGEEILPSQNTTPGPLEMEGYLRRLADRGGSHAVMEVSSHGIVQNRIAGIDFKCGIFTNLAPEHLDYHGTLERYLDAKASFFSALGVGAAAVLSRSEPASQTIARRTVARVVWYGTGSENGVERSGSGEEGLSFVWRGVPIRSRLWGEHNLLNILAAMTAAEALGFDRQVIARGIEEAVPPPGRLEEIPCDGVASCSGLRVFVDYAHTEGSLETVLRSLRAITPGRVIAVFGCGGDRDRQKRPRMGRVAERLADRVVITSDNPRSEEPERIIEEISSGLERAFQAAVVPDRREAIGLAILMAKPGDTVVIAGKGHETYQEIQGKRNHFDDREEARAALQRRARLGEESASSGAGAGSGGGPARPARRR
jgi:UDP-N-acetylmuramoyl-L-alanyl-D-glutamate--2,6-diaminopimelate ligase